MWPWLLRLWVPAAAVVVAAAAVVAAVVAAVAAAVAVVRTKLRVKPLLRTPPTFHPNHRQLSHLNDHHNHNRHNHPTGLWVPLLLLVPPPPTPSSPTTSPAPPAVGLVPAEADSCSSSSGSGRGSWGRPTRGYISWRSHTHPPFLFPPFALLLIAHSYNTSSSPPYVTSISHKLLYFLPYTPYNTYFLPTPYVPFSTAPFVSTR